MKFSNVYYIIKILEIVPDEDEPIYYSVNYEYINYSTKIYFGIGFQYLNALRSFIIKPLNRKVWYKAARECCNGGR